VRYADFIESVLREASIIANKNFGKVVGRIKPHDSTQVLTDTDIEIGSYLVGEVRKNYPTHNIIDEESGAIDNGSDFTWVIDPIDGTANFAVGVPTYGAMIGLLEKSVSIAGGLSLPSFNQIITAEKDKGAYLNKELIKVSSETDLSNTLIAIGMDPDKEDPDKIRNQMKISAEVLLNSRNLRSSNSVFDLVMLAKGSYGGWISLSGKIWDNVGPQIVLEEAGAVYTDYLGNPIDYSDPLTKTELNYTNCVASPVLHKKLQEIIHSI